MQPRQFIILLTCLIAALGRVIPHPWNMTPTIALSLLAGRRLNTLPALLLTCCAFGAADLILAMTEHQAVFGSWSLFTYSGLIITTVITRYWPHHSITGSAALLCTCSLGFWLWTNLGCWITMEQYPASLAGLLNCYAAALPFLQHQLLGDALWYTGLSCVLHTALPQRSFQSH